ncbi:hypothetical protein TheetDRAFT_2732 [Thermoanaerobacter ethanolicus JW 200]|nr:hypothetical protein TheetDRAFT_2732 [Thermoanaerobacter ethanolicus JW 200]
MAGIVAAAYIIPKIDMRKYRRYKDMIEKYDKNMAYSEQNKN